MTLHPYHARLVRTHRAKAAIGRLIGYAFGYALGLAIAGALLGLVGWVAWQVVRALGAL